MKKLQTSEQNYKYILRVGIYWMNTRLLVLPFCLSVLNATQEAKFVQSIMVDKRDRQVTDRTPSSRCHPNQAASQMIRSDRTPKIKSIDNQCCHVWSQHTFISHTDIATHSSPDVPKTSHFPQDHRLTNNLKGNVRKLKLNPRWHTQQVQNITCFVRINLFLVILMWWPLMCSLYFSGMISGVVASNHFVSAERRKDSWHAQLKLWIHLWIFCPIKCCSQEVLEKNLHLLLTMFYTKQVPSFSICILNYWLSARL